MDTVNLTNALKSLFGTSQTTATNLPICSADGTPGGNISVANLASVLGVVSNKGDVPANSDIGDFVTPGIWSFNQSLTGTPSGVGSGTLVVYKSGLGGGGVPIVQTIYCGYPGDKAGVYMRQMWGEGNWLNWQRIDNYGTSSLSDLATALGVIKRLDIPHTAQEEIYKLDFTYWNETSQAYRYCNFVVGNITGSVFCLGVAQEKTGCKISFGSTEDTIPYRDNDGNIYIRTGAFSPFSVYGYRVTSLSYTRVTGTVSLDSLIQISSE